MALADEGKDAEAGSYCECRTDPDQPFERVVFLDAFRYPKDEAEGYEGAVGS